MKKDENGFILYTLKELENIKLKLHDFGLSHVTSPTDFSFSATYYPKDSVTIKCSMCKKDKRLYVIKSLTTGKLGNYTFYCLCKSCTATQGI